MSQARSGTEDSAEDGKGGISVDKVEARKTYVEVLVRCLMVMVMVDGSMTVLVLPDRMLDVICQYNPICGCVIFL